MAETKSVGIIYGTTFPAGEAIRYLLMHPHIEIEFVTRNREVGRPLYSRHPNLLGVTDMRFEKYDPERCEECDALLLYAPDTSRLVKKLRGKTNIIDSGQHLRFRSSSMEVWREFYAKTPSEHEPFADKHPNPELMDKVIYGLPELHREDIKRAVEEEGTVVVATPGCNASAAILSTYPLTKLPDFHTSLLKANYTVHVPSSEAGRVPRSTTHHPERAHNIRPFRVKHRHLAEVVQECLIERSMIDMKTTSTQGVRGVFLEGDLMFNEMPKGYRRLMKLYRDAYKDEPFMRIRVNPDDPRGMPNTNYVKASNFCDVGFVVDEVTKKIVVYAALDNLGKGSAGNDVQCLNVIFGFDEREGLMNSIPPHPI